VEPFAKRVRPHQRFQLDDHVLVTTQLEVGLDPVLEGGQTKILEPPDLVLRERLVGEVGQRGAAPERERLVETAGRSCRLLVPCLLDESLKARGVELLPSTRRA